jgi:enamine deaminase RidA (YjgF/YER057c/UK114 family)
MAASGSDIIRLDTAANNRYSEVVSHGATLYLAGQVPADDSADFNAQCASVFDQIDSLLARAGSSKARILSATVYLKDIKDVAAMNALWELWMPAGCAPARATVGNVVLVNEKWLIEISVIAAREA